MSGENRRRRHRSLLARDGECCNYCGAPGELTIDHRFPKSLGGVDALWNLQLLCRPCNEIKGASGAGRETVLRLRGAQACCWLVRHGRSEWVLLDAPSHDAAVKAARAKWRHKLVSVKPQPILSGDNN